MLLTWPNGYISEDSNSDFLQDWKLFSLAISMLKTRYLAWSQ